MDLKTNFSFELYYTLQSASSESQRDGVMQSLGPTIRALLVAKDSAAKVMVSDSHKGSSNKIVEITTAMAEVEMYSVIKQFCDANGLAISVLE